MTELRFFAPGVPVPQGSKTPGMTRDGRLYVRENNSDKHKKWREVVRAAALEAMRRARWQTTPGAMHCSISFVFEARKGAKDAEGAPKISAPDLDKLVRCVLDSLTDAEVWTDDSRVVDLKADKSYTVDPAKAGAYIQVATVTYEIGNRA